MPMAARLVKKEMPQRRETWLRWASPMPTEYRRRLVLAETLLRIRKRTGLDQTQFARRLTAELGRSVDPSEVSRWESPGANGRMPYAEVFMAYLGVAGFDPDDLLRQIPWGPATGRK